MTPDVLLVVPAGVPWVIAAVLTFLDGRKLWVGLLGAAGLAASLLSLVWLAIAVLREGTVETVAGGWPEGVGISLRADALGVTFAAVSVTVILFSMLYEVALGVRASRSREARSAARLERATAGAAWEWRGSSTLARPR